MTGTGLGAAAFRVCFASCLAGTLLGTPAYAQQQVEISFGSGLSTPRSDESYDSTYEPFFPNVEHTGLATQLLTLDTERAPVFWGAIDWLPSPHAGFEARVDYRRAPIGGANDPYHVSLRYTARPPPDFIPREFSFEQSDEWPDTDGELRQLTVTGGLLIHAGRAEGAGVRFFAGGGVTNVRGTLEPLGYTSFLLGGHSVLFPEEMQATARLEPTTHGGSGPGRRGARAAGWTCGDHRRGSTLHSTRDRRPRHAHGDSRSFVELREVPVDELQRVLDPSPLHIRPTTLDFTIGLRVRL